MSQTLKIRTLLLTLVACTAAAVPSHAATWRVEKDGSGDFEIIQDALDAAAPGDSILIGPGRFDTFRPGLSTVNGYQFEAIIRVATQDLTIRGAGRDMTFVGPIGPVADVGERPAHTLYLDGGSAGTLVAAMQLDNTGAVVTIQDRCTLEDARVVTERLTGAPGIAVRGAAGAIVRTSEIRGPDGIMTSSGTSDLLIEDCEFHDDTYAGNHVCVCNGARDVVIRRSDFDGGDTGVAVSLGGSATIEDSRFREMLFSGINMDQGSAVVRRCELGRTRQPLAANIGWLEVYDSIIDGGSQSTLSLWCDVVIRGSHILNAGALTVRNRAVAGEIVDLRHNWWGTTDTTQIQGWIDDPNDTVLWSPIADAPLPAEESSVGELKGRFRR